MVSRVSFGAQDSAPTAPHATPGETKNTGPKRFWDRGRLRTAFRVTVVASLALHYAASPWKLLPSFVKNEDFEELGGEDTIPLEMLEEPPEPKDIAKQEPMVDPNAETFDASAPKKPDAKDANVDAPVDAKPDVADAPHDQGAPEAHVQSKDDGGDASVSDAAPPTPDAAPDVVDAAVDAPADAARDAEAGAPVRVNAGEVVAAGSVQAGEVNVVLVVNNRVIRTHPAGKKVSDVLKKNPRWEQFLNGTDFDPIAQTDYVMISGPSLINTDKDMVFIRYSAPDSAVESAIGKVAKKNPNGGEFDAGVPDVKMWTGFVDNGQRVFIRPKQSGVVVMSPPSHAALAAKTIVKTGLPRDPNMCPKGAVEDCSKAGVYLDMKQPSGLVRFYPIPKEVKRLRLWAVPRGDQSAEVFLRAECEDEATAKAVKAKVDGDLAGAQLALAAFQLELSFETNDRTLVGTGKVPRAAILSMLDIVLGK